LQRGPAWNDGNRQAGDPARQTDGGMLKMAITLTESAATRVKDYLARRGGGAGIRLGVKRTGCSGWAYVVDYADDGGGEDVVFEDRDVRVFVSAEHLKLIDGTEVDFVKHGLNEAFRFRNPNVKGECGCGESFSV
jgi:iron-sulfur cluster assembly protein